MMTPNQQKIARQQELIHKLSWNEAMGCNTSLGLEHVVWPDKAHQTRFVVFFDVDGVHDLNQKHGTYDAFDAMIKKVLSTVRSSDVVARQWNSSDEFLVCMIESPGRPTPTPEGLVNRLTEELAKHGLTAIFESEEVKSSILKENVKPAADRVLKAKRARGISR